MLSYLFAARGVPKRGPVRSRPPVDGTTARGGFGSRTAMMIFSFFFLFVCLFLAGTPPTLGGTRRQTRTADNAENGRERPTAASVCTRTWSGVD